MSEEKRTILKIEDLHKSFGDNEVLKGVSLELKQGEKGRVVSFQGGRGLEEKLSARGIRPGKKVTKVSEAFMGGPVTIKVDNCNLAIGHRMAARVLVEFLEGANIK